MARHLTIFTSARHLPAGTCDRIISVANGKISDISATHSNPKLGAGVRVEKISAFYNYYVEHDDRFTGETSEKLAWLFDVQRHFQLTGHAEPSKVTSGGADISNGVSANNENFSVLIEIGPRLTFATANSTNILSIGKTLGISGDKSKKISRVEQSVTYRFTLVGFDDVKFLPQLQQLFTELICDAVTETVYDPRPTILADLGRQRHPFYSIDILEHHADTLSAKQALMEANQKLRLGFDEQDIEIYTALFLHKLNRNPTNVELLDLAQSNSEHSRHWFFKGCLIIDGQEMPKSLLDEVMNTTKYSNPNNIIKFCDNSSGIVGFPTVQLKLCADQQVSEHRLDPYETTRHIIFTAETHNFPTAVEPFSGATTGTGGRIRDVQACGRGAHVIAGTAGYCFGNLTFPVAEPNNGMQSEAETKIQDQLTWQNASFSYPSNFAAPLKIAIEASNGASDYGNKFGEPVICGFARSFGTILFGGERCEWIKPIMFSGGIGTIEHCHVNKFRARPGMAVVKLGGPAYPIGVGGGAASSVQVQGAARDASKHDVNAVQRGDAQMEQKANRVLRACIEQLDRNPIRSIHDQGAGGNANVLKEIIEPCGADIYADRFQLGDATMSIDELWIAEYQENLALLIDAGDDVERFRAICARERCPYAVVGTTNDTGRIMLHDFLSDAVSNDIAAEKQFPVNLPVGDLLCETPESGSGRKAFQLVRLPRSLSKSNMSKTTGLNFDSKAAPLNAVLDKILLLPSVASKRWLTNKVDRSVTGLVVQQQCVGPWQTPLADYGLVALSEYPSNHFDSNKSDYKVFRGAATAIGEQPIKTTLDPARGAQLTVAEALSNLVFACITDLADVKCSANWMWPAKLPGEGAKLYDACISMCNFMRELRIAVDGGKDSLSMAAQVADGETTTLVKAPDTLVISAYAPCPDILLRVTPEFKQIGSILLLVCVSKIFGLKGTAYAQVMQQLNDEKQEMSDVEPSTLAAAFRATQQCISSGHVLAGHDVSDGGLSVCLLEMAFASNNIAFDVDLSTLVRQNEKNMVPDADLLLQLLFGEPIAWVLEVANEYEAEQVRKIFADHRAEQILSKIGSTIDAEANSAGSDLPTTPVVRFSPHGADKSEPLVELFAGRTLNQLQMQWERMSFELEVQQCHRGCVESEREELSRIRRIGSSNSCLPYEVKLNLDLYKRFSTKNDDDFKYRVGIVREEGTNGDRELAVAFQLAGFDVWDITMSDLVSERGVDLNAFNGLAFAGGFSFGDVCGSARGWAAEFKFNDRLRSQLRHFTRQRHDTFTLGVCNGCQLMCLLDLVYDTSGGFGSGGRSVRLHENLSGRFESRFSCVHIPSTTPSVMLRALRGSTLGVWVAHHEGRFSWANGDVPSLDELQPNLALQYVDCNTGAPTHVYPHNPNGSPHGVAGLCSADGRHLALMPHPERSVLNWQWPWMPPSLGGANSDWRKEVGQASFAVNQCGQAASPWLLMFESAKNWLRSLSTTTVNETTNAESMDVAL